jgi:predicted DNA-binding transcriptional regulator AlpA
MTEKISSALTVGELARRIGCPVHKIEYLIRSRNIQPIQRAGNARVFSEKDRPSSRRKSGELVNGRQAMTELNTYSADPRPAQVTLLNVKQVSELLGLHPRTVWKMAMTGDIPKPVKVGSKTVRWRLRDMDQFIAGVKL